MKRYFYIVMVVLFCLTGCASESEIEKKQDLPEVDDLPVAHNIEPSDTVTLPATLNLPAGSLMFKISSSQELPQMLSATLAGEGNNCGKFTSRGYEQTPQELELHAPFECLTTVLKDATTLQLSEPLADASVTVYNHLGGGNFQPLAAATFGRPPFQVTRHSATRNFTQSATDDYIDLADVVYLYAYFQGADKDLINLTDVGQILLPVIDKPGTRMPHSAFDNYTATDSDHSIDLYDVVYLFAFFQGAGNITTLEQLTEAGQSLLSSLPKTPTFLPQIGNDFQTVNLPAPLETIDAASLVIRIKGNNLPVDGWIGAVMGYQNDCGGYQQAEFFEHSSTEVLLEAPFSCLTGSLSDVLEITFNHSISGSIISFESNDGGGNFTVLSEVQVTTTSSTTTLPGSSSTTSTTTLPSNSSTTTTTLSGDTTTTTTLPGDTTTTSTTLPGNTTTSTSTTLLGDTTTTTSTTLPGDTTSTTLPGDTTTSTSTTTSTTSSSTTSTTTTAVTTTTLPGLVAHYSFEGNVSDHLGVANGTEMGTITYSDGKIGQAVKFDGSGYIETVANTSLTNRMLSGFTISVWINIEGTPHGITQIIEGYSSQPIGGANQVQREIFLETVDRYGRVKFNYNGSNAYSPKITSGKWHHLVATINNRLQILYLDGAPVAIGLSQGNLTVETGFTFGRDFESNIQYFKGMMDELRIYDRDLSYAEIWQLYKEEPPVADPGTGTGNGLMSHYTFEDNANDSAGSQHGTSYGNVAYQGGRYGKAAKFDGHSYIKLPQDSRLTSEPLDGFSISVWVNLQEAPQGITQIIEGYGDAPIGGSSRTQREIYLETINSQGKVQFDFTGNFLRSTPLTPGTWHHLAATIDSNSQKVYVDGTLVSEGDVTGDITVVTGFAIGRDYESSIQFFKGMMDDLKIYNKALHSSEVEALFNQ